MDTAMVVDRLDQSLSSCPALCRASTSFFAGAWIQQSQDVDGRVKPGHDEFFYSAKENRTS
jgi:hypothetical protein